MKRFIIVVVMSLLLASPVWATDVELAPGTPSVKSTRQSYFTGTGNIADSVSIPAQGTKVWEITSLSVTLSAAGAANNLTVTINSGLGSDYDTIILTQDMTSVTDLLQTYAPGELILDNGNTLDFAWTNGSSRTYGLIIMYKIR